MKYQGGGHVRAAGATMEGEPLKIIEKISMEVKEQLDDKWNY